MTIRLTASADNTGGTLDVNGTPVVTIDASGITSQFATLAETQAGVVTNKFVSPAGLAGAFMAANQALASSGYQKLPGGLIIQWGTYSIDQNTAQVLTLPIAWTTGLYSAVANKSGALIVGVTDAALLCRANTTNPLTQLNVEIGANGGAISHALPLFWFAIGK